MPLLKPLALAPTHFPEDTPGPPPQFNTSSPSGSSSCVDQGMGQCGPGCFVAGRAEMGVGGRDWARPGWRASHGDKRAVRGPRGGGRTAADLSGLFMPRTRQEKRLMRVPGKGGDGGEAQT